MRRLKPVCKTAWSRWQTNTAFQAVYMALQIMLTYLKLWVLPSLTLSFCNFAFSRKFWNYCKLRTMVCINMVVESGSVLIFLATTAYIPSLANGSYFRHSQTMVISSKERRLFSNLPHLKSRSGLPTLYENRVNLECYIIQRPSYLHSCILGAPVEQQFPQRTWHDNAPKRETWEARTSLAIGFNKVLSNYKTPARLVT